MPKTSLGPTPPTEPLLGNWSLTAAAALLVVGGICFLLPSPSSSQAAEKGAYSSQPSDMTKRTRMSNSLSPYDETRAAPIETITQKPAPKPGAAREVSLSDAAKGEQAATDAVTRP